MKVLKASTLCASLYLFALLPVAHFWKFSNSYLQRTYQKKFSVWKSPPFFPDHNMRATKIEKGSTLLDSSVELSFISYWRWYFDGSISGEDFLSKMSALNRKHQIERVLLSKWIESELNIFLIQSPLPGKQEFLMQSCMRWIQMLEIHSNSKDMVGHILSAVTNLAKTIPLNVPIVDQELTRNLFLQLLAIKVLPSDNNSNTSNNGSPLVLSVNNSNNDLPALANNNAITPNKKQLKKIKQNLNKNNDNFKTIVKLTFRCINVFPQLLSLPVLSEDIECYLLRLINEQCWTSAISLVKYYPGHISLASFTYLVEQLIFANEWTECGQFLTSMNQFIKQQLRLNPNMKRSTSSGSLSAGDGNIHGIVRGGTTFYNNNTAGGSNLNIWNRNSNVGTSLLSSALGLHRGVSAPTPAAPAIATAAAAVGIAAAAAEPSEVVTTPNLLTDPQQTFQVILDLCDTYLQKCIVANVTLSLRAAVALCQDLHMFERGKQMKYLSLKLKLNTFVKKGKWQLALQTAVRNMEAQICLYDCLVEDGQFIEANIVLATYPIIRPHVTLVSPEQLQLQLDYNAKIHLSFPVDKVKIVMVNSIDTLQYAANVFGFMLPTYGVASGVADESVSVSKTVNAPVKLTFAQVREGLRGYCHHFNHTNTASSSDLTEVVMNDSNINSNINSVSARGVDAGGKAVSNVSYSRGTEHNMEVDVDKSNSGTAGTTNKDEVSKFRLIVGLDSEWKVVMYQQNDSSVGACILQISTPDHAFLFDLNALSRQTPHSNSRAQGNSPNRRSGDGGSGGGGRGDDRRQQSNSAKYARNNRHSNSPSPAPAPVSPTPASARASPVSTGSNSLLVQTESLLFQIFIDPSILKVGWGFMNEDVKMIRRSGKGRFVHILNSIHSLIDLDDEAVTMADLQLKRFIGNGNGNNNGYGDRAGNGLSEPQSELTEVGGSMTADGPAMEPFTEPNSNSATSMVATTEGCDDTESCVDGTVTTATVDGTGTVATMDCTATTGEGSTSSSGSTIVEEADRNTKSLSNACQRYLGKSLNKFEQLSDWNSRTLTESQQHYAALDAHCLLALLDVLMLEKQTISDVMTGGSSLSAGSDGRNSDGSVENSSVTMVTVDVMGESSDPGKASSNPPNSSLKTPLNIALECYNCTEHVKGSVALLRLMADKEKRKAERKRGRLTVI